MNIKQLLIPLSLLAWLFISSCDLIDTPLKEDSGKCGNEDLPVPIRKILLEDFTGHKCVNCPDAAAKTEELKALYCDHIIPLSVHAGYFAKPFEPDYPEDFRTEEGETFSDFYNVNVFPSGLINRRSYNNSTVILFSNWAAAVDTLLTEAPELNLSLSAKYDDTNQNININLKLSFLKNISESLNLCMLVAEDSIIAPQLSSSGRIENYVHRHVLRQYINGTWGEIIAENGGQVQETISKQIDFKPDTTWNIEELEIIAYVWKSNSETKEIIQAESEHVTTK